VVPLGCQCTASGSVSWRPKSAPGLIQAGRRPLNEIPYNVWRDYDPEDTLRFYALRLQEAGMIKLTPQKIIAEHTDWRFLNELKRELKT
jgi:hypothetical protein